eukprot:c12930_g1_i1.p1 GENE.c12930_g1_i1~~c12930_g1_i1.p1  ORF type:complete len:243 (+),score=71.33 c12930_g1_i1:22-729(+)
MNYLIRSRSNLFILRNQYKIFQQTNISLFSTIIPTKSLLNTNENSESIGKTKPDEITQPLLTNERLIDFSQAKLQVSRLGDVTKPPNTEKLFTTQVSVNKDNITETKQLVTGLVGHYTENDLSNRMVVTVLNLKPAKLAGILSEVMLLAGENEVEGKYKVLLLEPPPNSEIGDIVFLEGQQIPIEFPQQINKKKWERVIEGLRVTEEIATFCGLKLMTSKGYVSCKGLPTNSHIH